MDLTDQLRKSVEEATAKSPVLKVRRMFIKEGGQLFQSRAFIGLETPVKGIGLVAAKAGVNHAADKVACCINEGVADEASHSCVSFRYEWKSEIQAQACVN